MNNLCEEVMKIDELLVKSFMLKNARLIDNCCRVSSTKIVKINGWFISLRPTITFEDSLCRSLNYFAQFNLLYLVCLMWNFEKKNLSTILGGFSSWFTLYSCYESKFWLELQVRMIKHPRKPTHPSNLNQLDSNLIVSSFRIVGDMFQNV